MIKEKKYCNFGRFVFLYSYDFGLPDPVGPTRKPGKGSETRAPGCIRFLKTEIKVLIAQYFLHKRI